MIKWTKEETILLKENMDKTLTILKEIFPSKSTEQIIEKIKLLYRKSPDLRYTDEEKKIIISNPKLTPYNLMKFLPNRSLWSIQNKRYELLGPIRRFPLVEKELKQLEELREEGYTLHEISGIMGRTLNSIMGAIYKNNLCRRNYGKQTIWDKQQELFIIENIKKGSTVEYIAKELNSTVKKVMNKSIHLGFTYKQITTEVKKERGDRTLNIQVRDSKIKELKSEISLLKRCNKQLEKQLIKRGI